MYFSEAMDSFKLMSACHGKQRCKLLTMMAVHHRQHLFICLFSLWHFLCLEIKLRAIFENGNHAFSVFVVGRSIRKTQSIAVVKRLLMCQMKNSGHINVCFYVTMYTENKPANSFTLTAWSTWTGTCTGPYCVSHVGLSLSPNGLNKSFWIYKMKSRPLTLATHTRTGVHVQYTHLHTRSTQPIDTRAHISSLGPVWM